MLAVCQTSVHGGPRTGGRCRRAASPPAGVRGVPANLFLSFFAPPQAAKEEKEENKAGT
ncbi:hypothetical protein KDAU_12780 [Dictyobacter aurantiacus]|uniref:Uncharacterized protein n=1 Tax=Dictyobacter aurantiacus TaxID=1936993 RepID=A0A401ZAS3_9CHLR|nr:hypothetical protein KDAU_12780 [Dictyobacter aurantiacus]